MNEGEGQMIPIEESKAKEYLEKLLYHISTTHLDMGGNHRYRLNPKAWPLISEIKVWLYENQFKDEQN